MAGEYLSGTSGAVLTGAAVQWEGDTTSASPTVTATSASGLVTGMMVVGQNIPFGTTITNINSLTITLSANATANETDAILHAGTLAARAFKRWSIPMQAGLPKVNNFLSPFQQLVGGMYKASINVEGPWHSGNMPFTLGSTYVFALRYTASLGLVVAARIGEIRPENDVEDSPRLSLALESTGPFVLAIT